MAEADFRLMTEVTGQRIAAALEALHLATVTGIKGDAEQNYRHGDVNITPANIGAVNKAGDTMTGQLAFQYNGNKRIQFSNAGDNAPRGLLINAGDGRFAFYQYHTDNQHADVFYLPIVTESSEHYGQYDILTTKSPVTIGQGGTGATQGTIDITDYCIFPTGNVNTSSPFGGRLYYNPYLNCVFGTITMNDGASVTNQADIVYLKKDSSGTPLMANREATCGVCVHSATSPGAVPRITGSTIVSSHMTGDAIYSPRYAIMAFLG